MKRYRNNKATFDPEILRYKAEVKQPRGAHADSPPSNLPLEMNPRHRTPTSSVKRRFPENLSTRSTFTGLSRKSNPVALNMRPLSSLADAFVAASSMNTNHQSIAVPAAKTPQLTRWPNLPKLSIPQGPGAERQSLPLTHDSTAQARRRTQLSQALPSPSLDTPSSTRLPPQTPPATAAYDAIDPAAVHTQLSALCRESVFSVDCAWSVYADTHSVECTATTLCAMEAAAEARGAELMGEGWTHVIGRLKRKRGVDADADGERSKKSKRS
ncbi:hypothetical protein C8R47DRAFT_1141386 [Mycena vitilis]|nr:hypothetical protein C8R47DRAFT_1141386 [Mycena vitilis]